MYLCLVYAHARVCEVRITNIAHICFMFRSPFIRPKLGKLHEASCMVSTNRDIIFLGSFTDSYYRNFLHLSVVCTL